MGAALESFLWIEDADHIDVMGCLSVCTAMSGWLHFLNNHLAGVFIVTVADHNDVMGWSNVWTT